LVDCPTEQAALIRPWLLTRGGDFQSEKDSLANPKAAPLFSEYFAPQFRLKQRLYSDDAIGVIETTGNPLPV
jgi:hypothetical protein